MCVGGVLVFGVGAAFCLTRTCRGFHEVAHLRNTGAFQVVRTNSTPGCESMKTEIVFASHQLVEVDNLYYMAG